MANCYKMCQNIFNRLLFGEDTDSDKVERFLDTVYTCVAGKTSVGWQTFKQSGRAKTCVVYTCISRL